MDIKHHKNAVALPQQPRRLWSAVSVFGGSESVPGEEEVRAAHLESKDGCLERSQPRSTFGD